MEDEIDPIAHLEDAIFRLRNIEDRWHVSDVHRIAVEVRDEILRPALLELQRREVAKAMESRVYQDAAAKLVERAEYIGEKQR